MVKNFLHCCLLEYLFDILFRDSNKEVKRPPNPISIIWHHSQAFYSIRMYNHSWFIILWKWNIVWNLSEQAYILNRFILYYRCEIQISRKSLWQGRDVGFVPCRDRTTRRPSWCDEHLCAKNTMSCRLLWTFRRRTGKYQHARLNIINAQEKTYAYIFCSPFKPLYLKSPRSTCDMINDTVM